MRSAMQIPLDRKEKKYAMLVGLKTTSDRAYRKELQSRKYN